MYPPYPPDTGRLQTSDLDQPSPVISPFPLSAGPFSFVDLGATRPPEGTMAVDTQPLKGQRPLTLCGLLQKTQISPEVLPLSDVNAKEELSRDPRGCPGAPRQVPDGPNAQKCNENHFFFNDFEMALDALWEHPSVAKGLPMAPQSSREMA